MLTSNESCHTLKVRFPSVSGLSGLTQERVYRKKKKKTCLKFKLYFYTLTLN